MITLTRSQIQITPLDAPLGAVVTELDTSQPLKPATILELKQALRDRHILIFKHQALTDQQLFNFATYFGDLFVPLDETPVLASAPGVTPRIVSISNTEGGFTGTGELEFHSDHHWTPYPSSGSMLYAIEVPPTGGDTYWLNLNLAYETLDDATKAQIADLQLITHNPFLPSHTPALMRPTYPHPIVRTHPESGKKILYLGVGTDVELVGVDPAAGAALIAQLRAHLNQSQFYYKHKWSVGDIVYWDNQATLHYREPFQSKYRRVLKRISLAGSRPF